MRDKALETIRTHRMLATGCTVTVALSGGADSAALLHLLCGLRAEWGLAVRAAHVNHNLRGAESLRDRRFAERLCAGWEVPLEALELTDLRERAKAAGRSLEEFAREERYRWFAELRERFGGVTATAHTLSDSLETALLNLARGTGPRGLFGVPPVREGLVRPLTGCTRAEVEAYCREHRIEWVDDSTNQSDDYARNRVRHRAVPALLSVNPRAEQAYARLAGFLAEDEDYLSRQARTALEHLRTAAPDGAPGCDAPGLAALHPALRYRALALYLAERGAAADSVKAGLLLEQLEAGRFVLELSGGCYAQIGAGILWVRRRKDPIPYFELPVREGLFRVNRELTAAFRITNYEHSEQLEKVGQKHLKNELDYDRINGDLVLRQRKDGDRIRLAGSGMTKSLKKLFQEARVPAGLRQNTPVLADGAGVVWVHGFGCSERVSVDSKTKTILTISITEGNEQCTGI